MSTPEQIAARAVALARVREDRIERDRVESHLRELNEKLRLSILAALEIGTTKKDVALAADVSHQRISQIARGQ